MHADHEHDDLHDRGLAFDLATLRARRPRPPARAASALKLLAGAGAGRRARRLQLRRRSRRYDHDVDSTTTTAGGTTTTGSSGDIGRRRSPRRPAGRSPATAPTVRTSSSRAASSGRTSGPASAALRHGRGHPAERRPASSTRAAARHGRRRRLRLALRPPTAATRCTPTASPTRTSCAGCRWPTPTVSLSFTTHLSRPPTRALAPHPLRGVPRPRHGDHRRQPHRHLAAGAAGGRLREVYATDGYEQSLAQPGPTSLDCDMVFSDGYDASWPPSRAPSTSG